MYESDNQYPTTGKAAFNRLDRQKEANQILLPGNERTQQTNA